MSENLFITICTVTSSSLAVFELFVKIHNWQSEICLEMFSYACQCRILHNIYNNNKDVFFKPSLWNILKIKCDLLQSLYFCDRLTQKLSWMLEIVTDAAYTVSHLFTLTSCMQVSQGSVMFCISHKTFLLVVSNCFCTFTKSIMITNTQILCDNPMYWLPIKW